MSPLGGGTGASTTSLVVALRSRTSIPYFDSSPRVSFCSNHLFPFHIHLHIYPFYFWLQHRRSGRDRGNLHGHATKLHSGEA